MARYSHVLAAIDLTGDSVAVLERARQVADEQKAVLSVATAIRPLKYAYAGIDAGFADLAARFEPEAKAFATQRLKELGDQFGFDQDDAHVLFGKPSLEINGLCEELGADLIVIGTHARKHLGLLLGSTANAVLHGAKNDVIAVRLVDKS